MRGNKYSKILTFTYVGVLVLFLYLTLSSLQEFDIWSLFINVCMLAIALFIFIAGIRRMTKIASVTKELKSAVTNIEEDFGQVGAEIWREYYLGNNSPFEDGICSEIYDSFLEQARKSGKSDENCKVDIGNFFNQEMLDDIGRKNMMNMVPGVMTGLGILGTFIGLSIGLQHFSTGSAKQISESISPLMSGIKVAFHTSIYGMIFSLFFNYAYSGNLEDAYVALDEFIGAFDKYVSGEGDVSAVSVLQRTVQDLPDKISDALSPQFDKMSATLEKFTNDLSNSQVEGVERIVDKFISEMNTSLGDNFRQLGVVIEETCRLQKDNNDYMQEVSKVGDMTTNIQQINAMSERTIASFSQYIDDVEKLQAVINDNYNVVTLQLEANKQQEDAMRGYIDTLVQYEKQISESSTRFSMDMAKQVEALNKMEQDISEGTQKSMEALAQKAEECTVQVSETAKKQIDAILSLSQATTGDMDRSAKELAQVSQQLNNQLSNSLTTTFDIFDKNLAEISHHLSGTISEIEATTGRVPKVVSDSYDAMEESYKEFQKKLETLIHGLDTMQRNMPRIYNDLMKN